MAKMFLKRCRIVILTALLPLLMPAVCVFASDTTSLRSPDMLALQGSWIRTDATYVIELSHAQNGTLQASYFNPKPINVGKTETAEQDGMVQIMVELQDINYPGSSYVLTYDRKQDILQGVYFQAATKKSYKVGFVRQVAQ